MDALETGRPLEVSLENHRAFLSYLERRVGDRALAEDILQDAFAKVVSSPKSTASTTRETHSPLVMDLVEARTLPSE
jgi:DNA-directed RNA polymerase specialized sigma24 family protein